MKNNYKLFCLGACLSVSVMAVIGAGGIIAPDYANAQRIELDPPPLVWQERPKKKEADNTEYWKKKYGLKSRAQLEAERKAAEEAQNNEVADDGLVPAQRMGDTENPQEQPAVTGSGDLNASGEPNTGGVFLDSEARMKAREEGDDMIGLPRATEDDLGSIENTEIDNSDIAPCNFSHFVGKNIASVNMKQFGRRPVRVLYPNQMLTMEYIVHRINFEVDRGGKILEVGCY